ncbi:uncharacterized protein HKW66_Vig0090110 [Vigna angularis]|uniref:Uncharacterized protein n=2 Tax=Phaseolus angularis TaxID=3914 RepID=A0A8T0KGM6_PHAAN|nr:protein GAMETE CELL DEFECTIVE 1, mitochondrial [Vigna angularis]KAG2398508.1 uncharacterized protein HKW66_Vig0090110 [Vigna angularis]BAT80198.1 hypothetical protein VIGAN_02319200 [Vigna angularis var. angularis]
MQALHRFAFATRRVAASLSHDSLLPPASSRIISFSTNSRDGGGGAFDAEWHTTTSWSTGLAGDHFNGKPSESTSKVLSELQDTEDRVRELEASNRRGKAFVDSWGRRLRETSMLMKQIQEPGARGSYLKDSEKAEMYRLHKENPEVYTVEKLAKDYRIMRQRVHAILWLKEIEEEEEKKLGHPLDDSIELLLDSYPEFFNSHDREFHVASLPYKPDFKVMPEGWDGITKDVDEVHYEISKKEDEMLYREFVEKMNFNKKKMAGEVKCHKYSRRRPSDGWTFTVEKLGSRGKRGGGGGWKFASIADGSSRPLNEIEKMYVRRETPRRRRRILP